MVHIFFDKIKDNPKFVDDSIGSCGEESKKFSEMFDVLFPGVGVQFYPNVASRLDAIASNFPMITVFNFLIRLLVILVIEWHNISCMHNFYYPLRELSGPMK